MTNHQAPGSGAHTGLVAGARLLADPGATAAGHDVARPVVGALFPEPLPHHRGELELPFPEGQRAPVDRRPREHVVEHPHRGGFQVLPGDAVLSRRAVASGGAVTTGGAGGPLNAVDAPLAALAGL